MQKAIARVLSSIDTTIEKTEALIAKHQQIKAGLMHDLFTRGVLPNGQLRPPRSEAPELYQETAVGWIPSDWSMSDCAREFAIDSGITLGPHRRPVKNARPYLRVANVHRDELRLEDVAYLEVLTGDADIPLKEKDLLIVEGHANRMEIGRCAMVTGNAIGMLFQNHLFRLRPHRLVSEFALYWLNSHHAQGYWDMACSTSSGLNTINRKMLGRLPVAVSAPDEQDRILRAISVTKGRIGGEKRLLDNLHRQKLGLMQDLLTGKVAVPMNPDPAQATA
jgi:type I restriction enzyme S subunit